MSDISETVDLLEGIGYAERFHMDGEWRPTGFIDLAARQREFHSSHG